MSTFLRLKFVYRSPTGDEVRRIQGQFTFSELQGMVRDWFTHVPSVAENADATPSPLAWQYRDTDGDIITLTTAQEWDECVREHSASEVIRIIITPPGSKSGSKGSRRDRRVVVEAPQKEPAATTETVEQVPTPSQPPQVPPQKEKRAPSFNEENVMIMYHQAMALMQRGCVVDSRDLLSSVVREIDLHPQALCPTRPVIHYNYACALALCGNCDQAVTQLNTAVDTGYCNVTHMMEDDDLKHLRARPDFQQVVRKLKKDPQGMSGVETEHPTHSCPLKWSSLNFLKGYGPHGRFRCDVCDVSAMGSSYHCQLCNYDVCNSCMSQYQETLMMIPTPVAQAPTEVEAVPTTEPAVPSSGNDEVVEALQCAFPDLSVDVLSEVLKACKGDLTKAANQLLSLGNA